MCVCVGVAVHEIGCFRCFGCHFDVGGVTLMFEV